MPKLALEDKLAILADAAKYDASCASSGTAKRDSRKGGLGSTEGAGICHAYAPDGRCISLLKILMTNQCVYDCAYCVNRASSNVRRARFTPEEIARLTVDFYRRNYIEGLFLSSGVIRSPDWTMEQLVRTARLLREAHGFRGYIHLKTIPDASPELIDEAGRWADRLSINVELPTEAGLRRLAPEKNLPSIRGGMGRLAERIGAAKAERKASPRAPSFAPAGQSTQMIVGADGAPDAAILGTSDALYRDYRLRRVYYSAYSPIPDASGAAPLQAPPLIREHRLYQADWLLRFYGFRLPELFEAGDMLPLDIDPKLAWALRNRETFPVRLDRADRELLLRVPGLGAKAADRLIQARRHGAIRFDDLRRLTGSSNKLKPFVETVDWRPKELDAAALTARMAPKPVQGDLFG